MNRKSVKCMSAQTSPYIGCIPILAVIAGFSSVLKTCVVTSIFGGETVQRSFINCNHNDITVNVNIYLSH